MGEFICWWEKFTSAPMVSCVWQSQVSYSFLFSLLLISIGFSAFPYNQGIWESAFQEQNFGAVSNCA